MAVRIITDSACDLSQEYASSRGITVIPLKVRFGDEEYLDGVTISPDAFYERLEKKDVVPKTSQITPYDYSGYFEETVRAGDSAVYIAMSAGVSGSWANACLSAAEYPGKIFVVDSRQFCISEGILAEEAARLRDQGKSAEEIASELEHLKDRVHVLSIFDTLEYLKLGGRLSSAAAWVQGHGQSPQHQKRKRDPPEDHRQARRDRLDAPGPPRLHRHQPGASEKLY